jgi:hypothetical protein
VQNHVNGHKKSDDDFFAPPDGKKENILKLGEIKNKTNT